MANDDQPGARPRVPEPLAVLQEAGVRLRPDDAVKLNGRRHPPDKVVYEPPVVQIASIRARGGIPFPARGPDDVPLAPPERRDIADDGAGWSGGRETWRLDVLRANRVTVVEAGVPFELVLAGETVGEALVEGGVPFFAEDALRPDAGAPFAGTAQILIRRAVPFAVETEGDVRAVRAVADTVGEALGAVGLPLRGRDYAIPAPETALTPGLEVQVIRVTEDILVQEVPIRYATVTQPDPELVLDQTRVLQPGVAGLKSQKVRLTYENGAEIDREVIEETVLREPVAEVIAYGTQIVWTTIDTPEGPRQSWRTLHVYCTSYSPARSGTPRSAPWYGRTRLGWEVTRGVVAVDPRVIPLGTKMYIPGYGLATAADTGGGVKRYLVDLGFPDDDYESWHKWQDIYLLEPLPPEDQMRWILP